MLAAYARVDERVKLLGHALKCLMKVQHTILLMPPTPHLHISTVCTSTHPTSTNHPPHTLLPKPYFPHPFPHIYLLTPSSPHPPSHTLLLLPSCSHPPSHTLLPSPSLIPTLQNCGVADASQGSFSSYAYILMVIHFLQRTSPPVVPVLQLVRSTDPVHYV